MPRTKKRDRAAEGATTWMPRADAAELLQVKYHTLRGWEQTGKVRSRKRAGRVEVALEDAKAQAASSSASPLDAADLSQVASSIEAAATSASSATTAEDEAVRAMEALPVRRPDLQRILDKALGADEWAHRTGVAETKAQHQAERLKELRDELKQVQQELLATRQELQEVRDETVGLREQVRLVRTIVPRRHLRKVGLSPVTE